MRNDNDIRDFSYSSMALDCNSTFDAFIRSNDRYNFLDIMINHGCIYDGNENCVTNFIVLALSAATVKYDKKMIALVEQLATKMAYRHNPSKRTIYLMVACGYQDKFVNAIRMTSLLERKVESVGTCIHCAKPKYKFDRSAFSADFDNVSSQLPAWLVEQKDCVLDLYFEAIKKDRSFHANAEPENQAA